MLNIKVILGSTRPNRFSEKTLPWLKEALAKEEGFEVEVLDLRDYPMPMYDQPMSPAYVENGAYGNDIVKAWSKKIAEADAFIVVAPEYNHGYTAVLKNAFDSVYYEWNNKPVAFVSYGGVGGARVVEQLREVAVELQMAPIRNAVHIQSPWFLLDDTGALKDGALNEYTEPLEGLLSQLRWWTDALKVARTHKV